MQMKFKTNNLHYSLKFSQIAVSYNCKDSRNFDRTLKNRVTNNEYSTSFTQAEFWKIAYARLSSDLQNIYKINMIKYYILSQQDYKQDSIAS